MNSSSPNPALVNALIFCGGEVGNDDTYETQTCEGEGQEWPSNYQQSGNTSEKKPNVYVELFEGVSCLIIPFSGMLKRVHPDMLQTLVETESHLFNLEELDYIARFVALSREYTFHLLRLN